MALEEVFFDVGKEGKPVVGVRNFVQQKHVDLQRRPGFLNDVDSLAGTLPPAPLILAVRILRLNERMLRVICFC